MHKKVSPPAPRQSTRAHIRELGVPRLSVHRTGQHIYAQVFDAAARRSLAAASTAAEADVREGLKNGKNADAAARSASAIAEQAKAAGIEQVAFDRSGFRITAASRRWPMPRAKPA